MTQPKTASKFTPGPWSLFKMYGGWALKGAKGEAHRIAAIMGTRKTDDDSGEAQANARLIAKAPEMYELLEMICTLYRLRVASGVYQEARRIKAEIDGEG